MTTPNAARRFACRTLTLLLFLGLSVQARTQVAFETFPQDYQLFARAKSESGVFSSVGEVKVSGTVGPETPARLITAQLLVGDQVIAADSATLSPGSGESRFELSIDVPVTRAEHTLRVILDNDASVPVATATGIVAGDVYLVNGQSNAVGNFALSEPDRDSFLRGFSQETGWMLAQFSNPGEWAGRAASLVSKRHDVPIAIFNFAVGSQPIQFFLPQQNGGGNYEMAVNTLNSSGIGNQVRYLLWFQGETDGWESTLDAYRTSLDELVAGYTEQFGIEHTYGVQTRTHSCQHPEPYVMEAQRQAAVERTDFTLLSSTNVEHDSCHFSYAKGYKIIGDHLADAISAEQFGDEIAGIYGPQLDSASLSGARQLTLYYRPEPGVALASTANPFVEFRAEGVPGVPRGSAVPTGGYIEGDRIVLAFGVDIDLASGVSYLSHAGPAPDFVHNSRGVGALTFYDVPLGEPLQRVTPVMPEPLPLPRAIEVFPNPVASGGVVNFKLPQHMSLPQNQVRVYAADGREHTASTHPGNNGEFRLATDQLPTGYYYLQVAGLSAPFLIAD